jgi:predicted dehydrogenase
MNQGIHTVDLLQWLFGPVASVSANLATRVHPIEAEDTAAVTLVFQSGAIGTIEAATSIFPGFDRRLELTGSEGTLIIVGDTLAALDLRSGREAVATAAPAANRTTPTVADATPHARIIQDFVDAVRTGRTPACDAREGRKSVAIVEASYESARSGRRVALEDGGITTEAQRTQR